MVMFRGKKGLFFDVIFSFMLILAIIILFGRCVKQANGIMTAEETKSYGEFEIDYRNFELFSDLAFKSQIESLSKDMNSFEVMTSYGQKNVVWAEKQSYIDEVYGKIYDHLDISQAILTSNFYHKKEMPAKIFALSLGKENGQMMLYANSMIPITKEIKNKGEVIGQKSATVELKFEIPKIIEEFWTSLDTLEATYLDAEQCVLNSYQDDIKKWQEASQIQCGKKVEIIIKEMTTEETVDRINTRYEVTYSTTSKQMPTLKGKSTKVISRKKPTKGTPTTQPTTTIITPEELVVEADESVLIMLSDMQELTVPELVEMVQKEIYLNNDENSNLKVKITADAEPIVANDGEGNSYTRIKVKHEPMKKADDQTWAKEGEEKESTLVIRSGPNGVKVVDKSELVKASTPKSPVATPAIPFVVTGEINNIPTNTIMEVGEAKHYSEVGVKEIEFAHQIVRTMLPYEDPKTMTLQKKQTLVTKLKNEGIDITIIPDGEGYKIIYTKPGVEDRRWEGRLKLEDGTILSEESMRLVVLKKKKVKPQTSTTPDATSTPDTPQVTIIADPLPPPRNDLRYIQTYNLKYDAIEEKYITETVNWDMIGEDSYRLTDGVKEVVLVDGYLRNAGDNKIESKVAKISHDRKTWKTYLYVFETMNNPAKGCKWAYDIEGEIDGGPGPLILGCLELEESSPITKIESCLKGEHIVTLQNGNVRLIDEEGDTHEIDENEMMIIRP